MVVVAIIFGGNFGNDKLGFVVEFWWWLSFGREEKECNFFILFDGVVYIILMSCI